MDLIKVYKEAFRNLFQELRSIDKFIVKSDEQDIENLLKNDSDKIKFQKTIDKMIRENRKTDTVRINHRDIKISI